MSNLKETFENGEEFKVDLTHLMDDIAQIYSFEQWKLPIVENVDNFIDEKSYHTISFYVRDNELRIEMKGAGVPESQFRELAKIAFTTKISSPENTTLGYYGWGLKATMTVAETIEIETKRGNFRGRQLWYWKEGRPYRRFENPCLNLNEEFTILIYKLREEYKVNEKKIVETLQEYYPTLLAGAPALGRRRKFYVNDKEVPKPDWLDESKYEKVEMFKDIRINGELIGGKIFISKKELPEEYRGIAIIVCGRKMEERIDLYPEVKKYTGYLHADVFAKKKYLIGDKTQIKRRDNPLWFKFKTIISNKLEKILKDAGLLRETTEEDRELIRRVYKVVTAILREMPELKDLGIIGPKVGKAEIYVKGKEMPVGIEEGFSTKTDIPHKGGEKWIDQVGWGEKGQVIKQDKKGGERANKHESKIKGYPQMVICELGDKQIEALYEIGKILINKQHPLYKSVEKHKHMRYYHVSRAGIEAILDYLLQNGEITQERYLSLKKEIIYLLGDNL
jgi:hypothetical protein